MLRSATALFCLLAALPLGDATPDRAPRKTVAVLAFDNYTGKADYDPLGKGIASMMISDLSSVDQIQVLERDRIQDVVKEMDAQQTKYYDSTTAVKVGRLAGAQYVVVGSFSSLDPKMRIDTRVVRVETGEVVKTAQVTGKQDDFFDLEQKLAKRLVDGLGVALSPEQQQALDERQQSNRMDHVSTLLSFSTALAMYDRGDYVGAVQRMAPVLQSSPNSSLVSETYDEMKHRASLAGREKAKEKVNDRIKSGLGGLLRRP
jgi:TolB-like protein